MIILFLNLQITISDARPHIKWADSLVIANMVISSWVCVGLYGLTYFITPEGGKTEREREREGGGGGGGGGGRERDGWDVYIRQWLGACMSWATISKILPCCLSLFTEWLLEREYHCRRNHNLKCAHIQNLWLVVWVPTLWLNASLWVMDHSKQPTPIFS